MVYTWEEKKEIYEVIGYHGIDMHKGINELFNYEDNKTYAKITSMFMDISFVMMKIKYTPEKMTFFFFI